jgi:ABC-type transport system substrate-binding protein
MNIRHQEWGSVVELLRHGDFDAVELGNAPHWEADLFPMWHSSAIAVSRSPIHFSHPDIDRLVEIIPTVIDPQRRMQLQHNLHRVLDRYQPCLFLYNRPNCALTNGNVRGINLFPTAPGVDLSRWTIAEPIAQRAKP